MVEAGADHSPSANRSFRHRPQPDERLIPWLPAGGLPADASKGLKQDYAGARYQAGIQARYLRKECFRDGYQISYQSGYQSGYHGN